MQFPTVAVLAVTATATAAVLKDVCRVLRIEACVHFRSSVDRPNLQEGNETMSVVCELSLLILGNTAAGVHAREVLKGAHVGGRSRVIGFGDLF